MATDWCCGGPKRERPWSIENKGLYALLFVALQRAVQENAYRYLAAQLRNSDIIAGNEMRTTRKNWFSRFVFGRPTFKAAAVRWCTLVAYLLTWLWIRSWQKYETWLWPPVGDGYYLCTYADQGELLADVYFVPPGDSPFSECEGDENDDFMSNTMKIDWFSRLVRSLPKPVRPIHHFAFSKRDGTCLTLDASFGQVNAFAPHLPVVHHYGSFAFGHGGQTTPDIQGATRFWGVVVPYWFLVEIFCIPLEIWLLKRFINRIKQRGNYLCCFCSYNLTGNTSGICPECGKPMPAASMLASKPKPVPFG